MIDLGPFIEQTNLACANCGETATRQRTLRNGRTIVSCQKCGESANIGRAPTPEQIEAMTELLKAESLARMRDREYHHTTMESRPSAKAATKVTLFDGRALR